MMSTDDCVKGDVMLYKFDDRASNGRKTLDT